METAILYKSQVCMRITSKKAKTESPPLLICPNIFRYTRNCAIVSFKRYFSRQESLFFHGDSSNFSVYLFYARTKDDLASKGFYNLYDNHIGYYWSRLISRIKRSVKNCGQDFLKWFGSVCRENNMVSESCRLHPFIETGKIWMSKFSRL